ncbi:hypothetical protein BH11BAC3_BH11BAC3_36980 [soil metagenome]
MMHNNDQYHYWGMHMGWWILLVAVAVIMYAAVVWARKKK